MNQDESDNFSRNGSNPGKLSASKRDPNASQSISSQRRCCNCKQSKCIKLYCECYAAGVYCNTACNCNDCWNNPNFEDHRKAAIQTTLEKNPSAFQPKISTPNFIEYKKAEPLNYGKHAKGCACKKSGCMKKYCECFQAGIPCSDLCKCADCHNTKEYYEQNKKKIGSGAEIKEEEMPDANSFFFKFLLAANEGEPNINNSSKAANANKKMSHINQEKMEKLYNKLFSIIDIPLDDYLKNKNYVKEVDRLNPSRIMFENYTQEKMEKTIGTTTEEPKINTNSGIEIEGKVEKKEHDDLMCDEKVEELPAGQVANKGNEMVLECNNESEGELKAESEKGSDESSDNSKYSFYKIKKYRILREFISVLRSIDS